MAKADVTMQSLGMQSHFALSGVRLRLRGAILGKANRRQEGDRQNARRALNKGHRVFPQKVDVGGRFLQSTGPAGRVLLPDLGGMNNFSGLRTAASSRGLAGFGTSTVIAEAEPPCTRHLGGNPLCPRNAMEHSYTDGR